MIDRVKDRLADQMRKIYKSPQPQIYGGQYCYVLGFTKEKGKKIFWGPLQEDEAYICMSELNDGELFKLMTRDPHRAVREVRDILVKRGEKPDEVLRRLLHKRPEGGDQAPPTESKSILRQLFTGRPTQGITRASPPPRSIVTRTRKLGGL